ncbi:carotenoid oxygenase family protein [Ancylothrix sp. C2]|uniref:carotenoid oxygenase family protein n=1 Tax=Ancylothrix sp. D3o TaxID=2953691 RepID=UPI0021BB1DD1|nr:carotenoid oxygenase family protein [Ancylothrix sp. D3o]MCT7950119.1 carotenoid oxygenase family protein [Ancylothrix sp. D3o]
MVLTAINFFLDGNFGPVSAETTTDNLKVIGEIPPDLSGMFVRNGPNPQFTPIGRYHWFDGDGMLHGLRITNGEVSYCNRYVKTQGFLTENEAGKALWAGLLEPFHPNPSGGSKNAANTALIYHAGRFLALWEGGFPHAISLPDLDTLGQYNFNGKLASSFTAHPKVDPVTGEMMFFGYSFSPPYVTYGVVSPEGELLKTVPFDLPQPVMMHDFAITENYTIFMDLPLTFSFERMQKGGPLLMFEKNRTSRFGIVPRHGDNSQIRWFECPPCYIFHTLNAYEDGDEVVLLACRTSMTDVLMSDDNPGETNGELAYLYRWRFNLETGEVSEEKLDERASDFPRINEQFLGRKTRYGYTAKFAAGSMPLFDGLIKYDFSNGTSKVHEFGAGRFGGEAVFVPAPNSNSEDDGWLVTFVYDSQEDVSELVIVSAKDVESEAVARVILPQRVPYGFHGIWVSQEQLNTVI